MGETSFLGCKHQIYCSVYCVHVSSSEAQLELNEPHRETSSQTSPSEENIDPLTRKHSGGELLLCLRNGQWGGDFILQPSRKIWTLKETNSCSEQK